jgi:hypothetical protein
LRDVLLSISHRTFISVKGLAFLKKRAHTIPTVTEGTRTMNIYVSQLILGKHDGRYIGVVSNRYGEAVATTLHPVTHAGIALQEAKALKNIVIHPEIFRKF